MLKTHAILEIEKNNHIYQFHLPAEAPLGEVHDVLYQMRLFVSERINEYLKAESQKIEEKKEE